MRQSSVNVNLSRSYMTHETKAFGRINKNWRPIMKNASDIKNVAMFSYCDEGLQKLCKHLIEQLQKCQKARSGPPHQGHLLTTYGIQDQEPTQLRLADAPFASQMSRMNTHSNILVAHLVLLSLHLQVVATSFLHTQIPFPLADLQ